jgi:class 3 adenylate cyclase
VTGDAGVGKTRLASELSRRAGKLGCTVLDGSCSEAELALPYLPFVEGLGNFLALTDLDQLRTRLGHSRRELAQLFPQLGSDAAPADAGDPSQAKLRLFEAILSLLRIPAEENGLLLVIEDLQWADASTRELLDYLTRRLPNSKIMVLATYRREELTRQHPLLPTIQGWRRSSLATVVELQPMSPDGVADMIRAIFDEERVTDEFRDFMHGRTEGNPFVLEEMLKTALDRQDIFFRPDTGIWDRKALAELTLPPTVREVIMQRVLRFSKQQREVVTSAAVLGQSFSYGALVTVSGRADDFVRSTLRLCVEQQLMEEGVGQGFRFRHSLTREAIYEDLIAPDRVALHAKAGAALRRVPGIPAADIAHHFMAADQWDQAIPVVLEAAEEAEHRRGYLEAADLYGRIVQHVTEPSLRGTVLCRQGSAHFLGGYPGQAQLRLDAGIRVLEQAGQQREAARYRLQLVWCHWYRGLPNLARDEAERVRIALAPAGPSEDLASAYARLSFFHLVQYDFDQAIAMADRSIAAAQAAGAHEARVEAYNFRGCALIGQRHVAEGAEDLRRSYGEAIERELYDLAGTAAGNAAEMLVSHFRATEALEWLDDMKRRVPGGQFGSDWGLCTGQRANAQLRLGQPQLARQILEGALPMARETGHAVYVRWMQSYLALTYAALGRFDDARSLIPNITPELERQDRVFCGMVRMRVSMDGGDLEEAARETEIALLDIKHMLSRNYSDLWPADWTVEVLVRAGRVEDAARLLEQAAIEPIEPSNPLLARMRGRVALARGALSEAQKELATAADFFRACSYRDDEWRTRRALAEVKTQMGDRVGAEAELRTVLTGAEEKGHVTEAEAARRQLRELGVEVAPAVSASPVSDRDLRQVGERFVTVMFADVRGYTALTARAAPPDLADRIATFYRWTEQEIGRHHGLVAQYGGDAMMATFNVSGMRLDHCLHALQAAIAIRDKAAYVGLPVGVGIAVGAAVVGQLSAGSPVTAVGETTNLAARLQAKAQASEIVLSQDAFRRVRDWLHSEQLEAREVRLSLKGIGKAVHAFVLPSRTSVSAAT